MKYLYIATSFLPKMAEKDILTQIQEINLNKFKDILVKEQEFIIKFAVTIPKDTEELIKITNIPIDGDEIIGKPIESEYIKIGDIVLLAVPTQSCLFRYFVITFHPKKKDNRRGLK